MKYHYISNIKLAFDYLCYQLSYQVVIIIMPLLHWSETNFTKSSPVCCTFLFPLQWYIFFSDFSFACFCGKIIVFSFDWQLFDFCFFYSCQCFMLLCKIIILLFKVKMNTVFRTFRDIPLHEVECIGCNY